MFFCRQKTNLYPKFFCGSNIWSFQLIVLEFMQMFEELLDLSGLEYVDNVCFLFNLHENGSTNT
jgi:hypothetical protein